VLLLVLLLVVLGRLLLLPFFLRLFFFFAPLQRFFWQVLPLLLVFVEADLLTLLPPAAADPRCRADRRETLLLA